MFWAIRVGFKACFGACIMVLAIMVYCHAAASVLAISSVLLLFLGFESFMNVVGLEE